MTDAKNPIHLPTMDKSMRDAQIEAEVARRMGKPFYVSKTMQFAGAKIASGIAGGLQLAGLMDFAMPREVAISAVVVGLTAIVDIVLRVVTKGPVTAKKS